MFSIKFSIISLFSSFFSEFSASSKLPPIELRLRLRLVNALFSLSSEVISTSVAPGSSQSEKLSSDKILHEVTTPIIGCCNSYNPSFWPDIRKT